MGSEGGEEDSRQKRAPPHSIQRANGQGARPGSGTGPYRHSLALSITTETVFREKGGVFI